MIHVLACGPLNTLQDRGRLRHVRSGVPVGGPADPQAFAAALALAGCEPDACAIELVSLPFTFACEERRIVAVTGPGVSLRGDVAVPGWFATIARPGHSLTVTGTDRTRFAYLAVSGGIDVPPMLGSRATHLGFGLGGLPRQLQVGDSLPLGFAGSASRAGRSLEEPQYDGPVRVLAGPHADNFEPAALDSFYKEWFTVESSSDRTGTRLAGPRVAARGAGEIRSVGMVSGAIQVPPGGAPIVLLADHQTTGGYPVIATVAAADIGRVAQGLPGYRLRFVPVERDEAVRLLSRERAALDAVR